MWNSGDKKNFCENFTNWIIVSLLKPALQTCTRKRNVIVKEKENSFILASFHLQDWKERQWFSMLTLFLEHIPILVNAMYF